MTQYNHMVFSYLPLVSAVKTVLFAAPHGENKAECTVALRSWDATQEAQHLLQATVDQLTKHHHQILNYHQCLGALKHIKIGDILILKTNHYI